MSTTLTFVTPAAPAPPGQPDISYAPDFEKWQARAAHRTTAGGLPTNVPKGFPEQLTGDLVWEGNNLAAKYNWTYVLNDKQLEEVDLALKHFKSLGLSIGHVTSETFPLPNLHADLRRLSEELHNGHGFFVIRGLRVDHYNREENVIIYTGISAHIAPQLGRQDHKFDGRDADVVLAHIKDLSSSQENGAIGSPAYTTDKQVFHTDSGDIVSLFALETAADGGASKLASTWRVYNEIARTRPDLIHTLSGNWDQEVFEKADKQWVERPLLFHFPRTESTPERVSLQYGRRYFVGFGALPRSPNIPAITEAQAEALDTLHFLGEKFCVNTNFQKGDIQYVNNLALFHARDGYTDTDKKKRHLMRFWLRDPEKAWQTPEVMKQRWAKLYEGISPSSKRNLLTTSSSSAKPDEEEQRTKMGCFTGGQRNRIPAIFDSQPPNDKENPRLAQGAAFLPRDRSEPMTADKADPAVAAVHQHLYRDGGATSRPVTARLPTGLYTQKYASDDQKSPSGDQKAQDIEDPLNFLAHFDTCFVIDDSASMNPYWDEVTALVRAVVPLCTERDTSGIDIYFANHKPAGAFFGGIDRAGYRNIGIVSGVPEMHDNVDGIFNHVKPRGNHGITKRLNQILWRYMDLYHVSILETRSKRRLKPLNIIAITAQPMSKRVPDEIIDVAERLDRWEAPSHQVGIQFFQVGDIPETRAQMEYMDDKLHKKTKARDIVDTVTWTGGPGNLSPEGVLKVVGGAIKRSIDRIQLEETSMPPMPMLSWQRTGN
ncbi:uncharacterized protein JN550_011451 [Neoarthrinium moseri]|uniref:uncharacterized protein n=1 Tax=Neoarthrinium moseri TaxID=1658444 RepID=UPI001FDDDBAF|nr:uncharacterized protein JN550_011451 [Neoarthrinium moseri]KAI1860603.1 hypothetical protein JN550_011451 [Neoarthrinium moseri]